MKNILILIALVAAIFVLTIGLITFQTRKEDPGVILNKLRRGKGDQQQLIMQFKLARGDRLTPMIEMFEDEATSDRFRGLLLDMMFARHNREPDERIPPILKNALTDPNVVMRRRVVRGYALFADHKDQVALLDSINDADAEVRKGVYQVFVSSSGGWRDSGPLSGVWKHLSPEQMDKLGADGARLAGTEEDPDAMFLARAVAGRRIAALIEEAIKAQQRAELDKAQGLIEAALALDPENHRARIRKARYHLALGELDKAIQTAEATDALLRIPLLPEAPVIDGDPTDQVWQSALTNKHNFYSTVSFWTGLVAQGKTKAYIGHHGGKLYVGMIGYEEELNKLTRKKKQRDTSVWQDDCIELIFDPRRTEKGPETYQFVINADNVIEDFKGSNNKLNFPFESGAQIFKDRGYAEFPDQEKATKFIDRVNAEPSWGITVGETTQADGKIRVQYSWSDELDSTADDGDEESAGWARARDEVERLGGKRVPPYWGCEFALDPKDMEDNPITKDSLWGMIIIRTRIGPGAEQTQWWPTFGRAHNPDLYPLAVFEGL